MAGWILLLLLWFTCLIIFTFGLVKTNWVLCPYTTKFCLSETTSAQSLLSFGSLLVACDSRCHKDVAKQFTVEFQSQHAAFIFSCDVVVKSAGPENESSLEPWARNRDLKIWGRDFIFSRAIPNAAHLRCWRPRCFKCPRLYWTRGYFGAEPLSETRKSQPFAATQLICLRNFDLIPPLCSFHQVVKQINWPTPWEMREMCVFFFVISCYY